MTAPQPRQRRHARTRDAVVETALDLLAEGGLEAITIREVARRLDYSPGALYRYFTSRDEIIGALAAESATMLAERLRQASRAPGGDPLLALGEAYLRFAGAEPVRFRLMFVELTSARSTLASEPAAGSPYRVVLEAAQAAVEAGAILPEFDAETVAYALWATVHGMAVLEQTHLRGFDADFDSAHRTILRLLLSIWKKGGRP